MDFEHLAKIQATATCLHDQKDVEAALDKMATEITDKLADANPVILCVVIGGIITTGQLVTRLDFPLQVDYVHASRYRGETSGSQNIVWKAKPDISLAGRTVLIVDDILDGGITLAEVSHFAKTQGAKDVYTAALVDKYKCREPDGLPHADFVGLSIESYYVFGYGLDYKNYLRNANGIYAVDPSML